jgi:hypothetical protein
MNNGGGVVAPGGAWKGGPRVRFVRSAAKVEDWSPWQGLVFGCFEDGVRLQPWGTPTTGAVTLERMPVNGAQCGEVWHRCVALIGKKGYGTVRGWWRRVSGRGSEDRMTGEEFIEKTRQQGLLPQPDQAGLLPQPDQAGLLPQPNQPGLYLGKREGRVFWVFWVG